MTPTIEAIRARWAAATPGPWTADADQAASWEPDRGYARHIVVIAGADWMSDIPETGAEMARQAADAEAIAAAPTDVATLLAEVDRLRAELADAEEALQREMHDPRG